MAAPDTWQAERPSPVFIPGGHIWQPAWLDWLTSLRWWSWLTDDPAVEGAAAKKKKEKAQEVSSKVVMRWLTCDPPVGDQQASRAESEHFLFISGVDCKSLFCS